MDPAANADIGTLRAAVQAGLDSRPSEPLDMAAIKAEARALRAGAGNDGLGRHRTPSSRGETDAIQGALSEYSETELKTRPSA